MDPSKYAVSFPIRTDFFDENAKKNVYSCKLFALI